MLNRLDAPFFPKRRPFCIGPKLIDVQLRLAELVGLYVDVQRSIRRTFETLVGVDAPSLGGARQPRLHVHFDRVSATRF